jgi:hypothetical protein
MQMRRRAGDGVDRTWRQVEKEFVRACEHFVTGRYAEYLDDRGRPAPEWAWVNELAHCSPAHLADLSAGKTPHRYISGNTRTWEEAMAFLAEEVIDTASACGTELPILQFDVLVPLELRLARARPRFNLGPLHLVQTVTEALVRYRAEQRRANSRPRQRADGADD